MSQNKYEYFVDNFAGRLPVGESFDLVERKFIIGGKRARMYFVDGLTDGQKCQFLLNFLLKITYSEIDSVDNADDFVQRIYPFLDTSCTDDTDKAATKLYSGLVPLIIDGLDKIIIADAREYPDRSVEEPEKEKSLRGAKDGFTENFMSNLGLIRRRIRDNRLIFKSYNVGKSSRTDVAIGYMKGIANPSLVTRIDKALQNIDANNVSVGDQSIVQFLLTELGKGSKGNVFNPFPKVRYTQRPDIIAAHITEGKIAVVVDNTPSVLLLPVGIFDFSQSVDDYYFPLLTGNFFRMLRMLNMLIILLLSPVYLLVVEHDIPTADQFDFIVPKDDYAIPVFWQFIILELAIDGLKLASVNTPESLGMSLSVIGALILGEFSVDSGWLISQTILVMAVIALASFTQPSIELAYGVKFLRVLTLISCAIFRIWGLPIGLLLSIIIVASTKTIGGNSYLYPLIPFDWPILKKLLFRTQK